MHDYSEMMRRAKEDIHCAVKVWGEILPEMIGSQLESIYTKGSSNKHWDTHIDYVPIISDVDIHITLKNDKPLFGTDSKAFDKGVEISRRCEEEFIRRKPDYFHIPRMQIIETRFLKQLDRYTPPRLEDISILYGKPLLEDQSTPEFIREGDLENILEQREYIFDMPRRVFDRTGLDWWAVIRGMSWRISPSPVRILSQIHSDPIDVWSWNRTRVHSILLQEGFENLAKHYYGFFDSGWRLFLSEFKDLELFRDTAVNGYYVLWESVQIAENLQDNENTS